MCVHILSILPYFLKKYDEVVTCTYILTQFNDLEYKLWSIKLCFIQKSLVLFTYSWRKKNLYLFIYALIYFY